MYAHSDKPFHPSKHRPHANLQQGGGIQDVKFIPGNKEGAALATAVHLGQVWIIYPERKDEHGKPGVTELLYDLGPKARDTTAI